jgi:predicted phosphoadenosine phosphosulfate sulfurtransferase
LKSGFGITKERINDYVGMWKARGYPEDLPDEVPILLMKEGLAPSYKAICLALLRNDNQLQSLGFTTPVSPWYVAIKRVEIEARPQLQLSLPFTT